MIFKFFAPELSAHEITAPTGKPREVLNLFPLIFPFPRFTIEYSFFLKKRQVFYKYKNLLFLNVKKAIRFIQSKKIIIKKSKNGGNYKKKIRNFFFQFKKIKVKLLSLLKGLKDGILLNKSRVSR
mmetsp:Transcript_3611/g.7447  ORF Transcript_3611/g.7447 Transcript_3611/m.7447 type:complete len:125 (-) Transcript_3611:79-453(-)